MMRKAFLVLSTLLFALMMAGLVIAVIKDWPALFFPGSPASIEIEAMAEGTALSPPIWALIPFGLLIPLGARRDARGRAAIAAMVLLSLAFLAGAVWQAVGLPSLHVPQEAVAASAATGAILSALVAMAGTLSLLVSPRP